MLPSNIVTNQNKTLKLQAKYLEKQSDIEVSLQYIKKIIREIGVTTRETCISLDINSHYLISNIIH